MAGVVPSRGKDGNAGRTQVGFGLTGHRPRLYHRGVRLRDVPMPTSSRRSLGLWRPRTALQRWLLITSATASRLRSGVGHGELVMGSAFDRRSIRRAAQGSHKGGPPGVSEVPCGGAAY